MSNSIQQKNDSIQGLRGMACLVVFLGHFTGMYYVECLSKVRQVEPLNLFFDGSISVVIFFVLSGFYIYKHFIGQQNYLMFVINRCKRLLPEFWITSISGALLCNIIGLKTYENLGGWANEFWMKQVSYKDLILYMLLRGDYKLINPPTWTVRIEVNIMFFYGALIFILSTIDMKISKTTTWEGKLNRPFFRGLLLMSIGIISIVLDFLNVPLVNFYIIPVALTGAASYVIIDWLNERELQTIPPVLDLILLILSIFMLDIKHIAGVENGRISDYIMAVGTGILIILCYKGRIIKHLLSNRLLVMLGNISYEIYLVHFLVLLGVRSLAKNHNVTFLLFAFVLSIIFAWMLKSFNGLIMVYLDKFLDRKRGTIK